MTMPAPIALFAFNRPKHLQRTIDALAANSLAAKSVLNIFCDGPRSFEESRETDAVRAIACAEAKKKRFITVRIVAHSANMGCAPSIISGVTNLFKEYEQIIVLEDDILVEQNFLLFMNQALEIYKNSKNVGMIHGHIENIAGLPEQFFIYKSGCLGWATWRNVWNHISFDGSDLLRQIEERNLKEIFDINSTYPYTHMLRDQIAGKNSSWAIRVYASFLLHNQLTLYPGESLAVHIGYDGGTHTSGGMRTAMDGILTRKKLQAKSIPIVNCEQAIQQLSSFYSELNAAKQRRVYYKKICQKMHILFIARLIYHLFYKIRQFFQQI